MKKTIVWIVGIIAVMMIGNLVTGGAIFSDIFDAGAWICLIISLAIPGAFILSFVWSDNKERAIEAEKVLEKYRDIYGELEEEEEDNG